MIIIPGIKKKNVAVFGLGVSGIATCEALAASGANVFSFDENAAAREKTAHTEYRCEHPKDWPWDSLEAVAVSPGVPLNFPKPHPLVVKARRENVPVIGDTELFAWAINALPEEKRPHVIGVTGSNGKSTTAKLIGYILKEAGEEVYVGGNIGEAVLSMPAPNPNAYYVLELSSYQLDLTETMRLNTAVFLNLTPDHLERHGSMDGYFQAKRRIFLNQTKDDNAVIGVDDEYGEELCTELSSARETGITPILSNGALGRGVYGLGSRLFVNLDGKTALAGDLSEARSLRGVHNMQNVAAAVAVCAPLGVAPAIAVKTALRFEGLAHRMETVARIGKVLFVNDSKATNIDAVESAIAAYSDVFWIAGGRAKEGGVKALREKLGNVRGAFLIGEAAEQFEMELAGAAPCVQCGDIATAVKEASAAAMASNVKEPVVLFSPACASFDQYKNFEERGEVFRECVNALAMGNGAAA